MQNLLADKITTLPSLYCISRKLQNNMSINLFSYDMKWWVTGTCCRSGSVCWCDSGWLSSCPPSHPVGELLPPTSSGSLHSFSPALWKRECKEWLRSEATAAYDANLRFSWVILLDQLVLFLISHIYDFKQTKGTQGSVISLNTYIRCHTYK